jgi:predicted dehydrogenase
LSEEELAEVIRAQASAGKAVMVGFNRRFASMAVRLKAFFAAVREPLMMQYRVNAGFLDAEHWTQDPEVGGGRILGEVCHFVDFLTFIAGASPVRVRTNALANSGLYSDDNLTIHLEFANGSQGTITYVANGDKAFAKERVEVFGGGGVGVLEDFRELELSRGGRKQSERSRFGQDKGHRAEWEAFLKTLRSGGPPPIPFEEIVAVSLATLRALASRRLGEGVAADTAEFFAASLSPGSEPA